MVHGKISVFAVFFYAVLAVVAPEAQVNDEAGTILSISGNTVVVNFETISPGLGDEVVFKRVKEIVDPVTNRVWGGLENEIATGVVEDMGLGKVYVNIVTKTTDLLLSDIVYHTGREKKIRRTNRVVGKIQQLVSEKEIEIDVGAGEEINEGDSFLINRTENVFDPQTNEVKETKQVEIGRGRVNTVADKTSRAEIVEMNPGYELNLKTDNVVFEPDTSGEPPERAVVEATEADALRSEIGVLREKVRVLRATVDSLGLEHHMHRNEFDTLKGEMDRIYAALMKGDLAGTKILLKNDEPITPRVSSEVLTMYAAALDACLKHDFEKAIGSFRTIIERYPDSRLTENSRYWIAQSYFSMQDNENAVQWFSAVIEDTRFTHKDDDASIMLGITYYRMGEKDQALGEFQKFIIAYPDSEYIEKVRSWIQRLS